MSRLRHRKVDLPSLCRGVAFSDRDLNRTLRPPLFKARLSNAAHISWRLSRDRMNHRQSIPTYLNAGLMKRKPRGSAAGSDSLTAQFPGVRCEIAHRRGIG